MEDKAKGRMKEAYGAITGDEDKKAEGRAQQRKLRRKRRPSEPRRRPGKRRGSATGSGASRRVGYWVTSGIPCQDAKSRARAGSSRKVTIFARDAGYLKGQALASLVQDCVARTVAPYSI
jgi:hypothetical protein